MYAINITKNGNNYEAWIYRFSVFTPSEMIVDGDVGLDKAECHNTKYELIYPLIVDTDKLSALHRAAKQIHENIHLSFWGCAFEDGKYSKDLTVELGGSFVALILPKDCY